MYCTVSTLYPLSLEYCILDRICSIPSTCSVVKRLFFYTLVFLVSFLFHFNFYFVSVSDLLLFCCNPRSFSLFLFIPCVLFRTSSRHRAVLCSAVLHLFHSFFFAWCSSRLLHCNSLLQYLLYSVQYSTVLNKSRISP